jgi:hypothetical protein
MPQNRIAPVPLGRNIQVRVSSALSHMQPLEPLTYAERVNTMAHSASLAMQHWQCNTKQASAVHHGVPCAPHVPMPEHAAFQR